VIARAEAALRSVEACPEGAALSLNSRAVLKARAGIYLHMRPHEVYSATPGNGASAAAVVHVMITLMKKVTGFNLNKTNLTFTASHSVRRAGGARTNNHF